MTARDDAFPLNPNQLPPRAAMGLPEALADRLGADVLVRHADLLRWSAQALVATLESPGESMDRRYAAGAVLAHMGEPRIQPLQPQMVRLCGGRVTLGLVAEQVEEVAARWRHAGVLTEWIEKECPPYTVEIAPFRDRPLSGQQPGIQGLSSRHRQPLSAQRMDTGHLSRAAGQPSGVDGAIRSGGRPCRMEFTADLYRPYPGGRAIRDDLQRKQGDYRVARGGSFARYGDLARCRRRHGWYHSPIYAMGFRLAESL